MEQPAVRADILGRLLLVQQTLDVLPDNGGIAAFLRRALGEIPGVIDVHLCVEGAVFPPSDEFSEACARYEASWSASGTGTECLVGSASTLWVPLRTARHLHGALILSLGAEEAFSPYRDFIQNIANVVATTLETRQYIRQLDDARAGLEDQVAQRTARLGESEERFRGLFENMPVPIWEEDFSEAWAHLERLPRDEIDDIDAYLREHPGIVHRCAELVRVIDVNEAAVRLHQAAGKDELLAGLTRTFTPESFETFRQELVAMWSGGTRLQADAVVRTLAGAPRSATISWAVSPGHEERFGRVIVAEVDITERRLAEEALRESENKFRQVSASAQDAVIVLDQDGRITDWNAAAERIFGYPASEVIGQDLHPLVVPARHRDAYRRGLRRFRKTGTGPVIGKTLELVALRRDGAEFPIELSISSVQLRGEWHAIGMVRDITERERAQEQIRRSEERYRSVVTALSEGIVLQDADGAIQACNASAEAITGLTQDQMMGLTSLDLGWWAIHEDGSPFPGQTHPAMVTLSTGEPCSNVIMGLHKPDGTLTWISINSQPLLRSGETKPYAVVTSFTDITERVATEAERSRLLLAVEQTADSVMVTYLDWTIVYVNQSFARVYGYEPEEVVGRNAVILSSGRHDAAFWEAIRDTIAAGGTWSGSIVNRRKDGTLVEVERVISAIRDPVGRLTSYVQADRDVTHEREVEEELATGLRIRAAVAESLIGLRPGQGVPEIAQAICDNVATVPQLDVAILAHFLAEDSAIVTAVHAPPGFPLQAGQALPPGRSRFLYRRAKRGPWAAHWKARAEDAGYGRAISASGLKAVAYGPILHQGTPVGLLTIGTMHEEFARDIVTRAPALAEFSATSSALLAGPLDALRHRERERTDLQRIIASVAFGPVFQPIQDLATGEIVGYEALTRFADGCRPDRRFGSAWSVGLGIELELATLEVAVVAAAGLPAGRWLDINVSPRLLQTPERLTEIVRRVDRPLVIEITEHDVIEDYPATRDAVRALGPNTRLAVDDAGAGIANFAHIIELRPDFVKLDIGLVRGVNTDLGRQALVIAMLHFSRTAGCRLVAEGVETEAEADTLAKLGVHFGQGYWFGRPQSVAAFASTHPGPPS